MEAPRADDGHAALLEDLESLEPAGAAAKYPVDLSALSTALAHRLHEPAIEETAPQAASCAASEGRISYRCSTSEHGRRGRLKLLDKEFAIEVLDESSTGMSIAVNGPVDCWLGQTALVELASAWIEVRVMNSSELPPAPNEQGSESEPRTRLGLLRLRDVDAAPVDTDSAEPFRCALLKLLTPVARTALTVVGLLAAAAIVVGILLYVVELPQRKSQSAIDFMATASKHSARFAEPDVEDNRPAPLESAATVRQRPKPATRSAGVDRSARPAPAVRVGASSKAAPVALTPPRSAGGALGTQAEKALALSPEQEDRLRELLPDDGRPRGQSIYDRLCMAARLDSADPGNAAARRALEVLTDAQRAALAELVAEK